MSNFEEIEISGVVIKGNGLGKKIGFPTLNIAYDGKERGIFAGTVLFEDKVYKAAIHVGPRASLGEKEVFLEAYLFDFHENTDLYGKNIRVRLLKKIRDSSVFKNLDELKTQIVIDVKEIERILF